MQRIKTVLISCIMVTAMAMLAAMVVTGPAATVNGSANAGTAAPLATNNG